MAENSRHLFDDQRRFSGAVGASLSHEINNVLAIVQELNGLLEDLHTYRREGEAISPSKLADVTGRIGAEIGRGKGIVKQLNGFAHAVDVPESTMDLGEALSEVIRLYNRLARLREVGVVEGDFPAGMKIAGNRFDLLHLLFRAQELAVVASPAKSTVDVTCEAQGEGFVIRFRNRQPGAAGEAVSVRRAALKTLTARTGGGVAVIAVPDAPVAVTLSLPPVLIPVVGAPGVSEAG